MKSIHVSFKPKSKLKEILCLILMLAFQNSYACSCHNGFTVCSLIENLEESIFIKAKVLTVIDFANFKQSVLLEVETNFTPDVILTDTIELIGGMGSLCQKSLRSLKPGETTYIGLGVPSINSMDLTSIPISSDTYWRHAPHACYTILLEETEDQIVGPITKTISRYPKELFDQNVLGCQFKISDIDSINCPSNKVYPNPVIDNQIFFENSGSNIINNISIYSTNGQLILRHENELDELVMRLPELNVKIIILEYYCGTQKHIEKLFVN